MLGCSSRDAKIEYSKYSSEDPAIGISMYYPRGWRYAESRGAKGSYAEVQFNQPRKDNQGFVPFFSVTVFKASETELSHSSMHRMMSDLLDKRKRLPGLEVLSRSSVQLLGEEAADTVMSYSLPDNLKRAESRPVPVMERLVVVKKDGRFYVLMYLNTKQDYPRLEKVWEHCMKAMMLKE
jgi:hypothetical protein